MITQNLIINYRNNQNKRKQKIWKKFLITKNKFHKKT